jgi:hypothetical protein
VNCWSYRRDSSLVTSVWQYHSSHLTLILSLTFRYSVFISCLVSFAVQISTCFSDLRRCPACALSTRSLSPSSSLLFTSLHPRTQDAAPATKHWQTSSTCAPSSVRAQALHSLPPLPPRLLSSTTHLTQPLLCSSRLVTVAQHMALAVAGILRPRLWYPCDMSRRGFELDGPSCKQRLQPHPFRGELEDTSPQRETLHCRARTGIRHTRLLSFQTLRVRQLSARILLQVSWVHATAFVNCVPVSHLATSHLRSASSSTCLAR